MYKSTFTGVNPRKPPHQFWTNLFSKVGWSKILNGVAFSHEVSAKQGKASKLLFPTGYTPILLHFFQKWIFQKWISKREYYIEEVKLMR